MHKTKLPSVGAVCGLAALAMAPLFTQGTPPCATPAVTPHTARADVQVATPTPVARASDSLDEYQALLNQAEEHVRLWPGYTAVFVQQVSKDGVLHEVQEIDVKVRHEPFSVYMKWRDKGQEVLYVDGENDGRLLARRTKGLFQRTVKLQPASRIAMLDARQPVTEVGLLGLVVNARKELHSCPSLAGVDCEVSRAEIAGKAVRRYRVTFDAPTVHATYSHCDVCFRDDAPVPVSITCYGWSAEGKPGELLEYYRYHSIRTEPAITDDDFDPANAAYAFQK